MNIKSALQISGLDQLDKEILLSYTIEKPREYLLAHPEKKLTERQVRKFNSFLRRRRRGEPIAHLRSQKEFYGLDFLVDKNVLIPRPETEILVEKVLNLMLDTKYQIPDTILDIGAGSGNIILSIVKNIPEKIQKRIKFYAVDISEKALAVARKNAKKHQVDRSIKFIKSDLLESIKKKKAVLGKNILITANLPYVSPVLYKKHRKGLRFEPKTALLSQKDGLGHYTRLFKEIRDIRAEKKGLRIRMLLEISSEQKRALQKIIKDILPKAEIYFQKDLAGKWRMANIYIT